MFRVTETMPLASVLERVLSTMGRLPRRTCRDRIGTLESSSLQAEIEEGRGRYNEKASST